jgi:hypothetical protein
MKVIKHMAGIILVAVGVLFLLVSVAVAVKPDPDIPRWGAIPVFLILGVFPLWGGYRLLRSFIFVPAAVCPQCGSSERRQAVLTRGLNPWVFFTGGAVISALWGSSRKQQARCKECETAYGYDTRGSRIAGVCFWIIVLFVLCGYLISAFEHK